MVDVSSTTKNRFITYTQYAQNDPCNIS